MKGVELMPDISKTNIVRIDLSKTGLVRNYQPVIVGAGDIDANVFGVEVLRGMDPVDLTGAACVGYFIRPNRTTVVINGDIENNIASVTLPQSCYAYEGAFSLAIKVSSSGDGITGTLRIVDGSVINTTDGEQIDPGTTVPDLAELLAQIAACEAATADAEEAAESVAEYEEQIQTNATNIAALQDEVIDTEFDPSFTGGRLIRWTTGATASSSNAKCTNFINIEGFDYIRFSNVGSSSSTSTIGMAFYSSDDGDNYIDGIQAVTDQSQLLVEYFDTVAKVPEGAKYARFTAIRYEDETTGAFYCYGLSKINARIAALELRVRELESNS